MVPGVIAIVLRSGPTRHALAGQYRTAPAARHLLTSDSCLLRAWYKSVTATPDSTQGALPACATPPSGGPASLSRVSRWAATASATPASIPPSGPRSCRRALDLGVTFFDTSENYNEGRSEAVLGEVTSTSAAHRSSLPPRVASRAGASIVRDFSEESITRAAGAALRRLQRESIELYMLHSPTVDQLENDTWPKAIETLKAEGTIRYFGISTTNHASGIRAIEMGADFLQIEYDLLDPTAEDALLPLAIKQNIGIMTRTPLARGLLSGKFRAGEAIPAEQQWRRPTGDRLQLRLHASSSFASWSGTARTWPKRRCAGCWPSRASIASSPAPGPSSSSRRTSAPSTAT